jgi:hypothetical protein
MIQPKNHLETIKMLTKIIPIAFILFIKPEIVT